MEDIPNPKFSSDSKALIDSVLKEFPAGNSIEIYVLSPSGRSQEVFSGPSRNLSSNDFRYVSFLTINIFLVQFIVENDIIWWKINDYFLFT